MDKVESRVFVVNSAGHDFSDAKVFGKIIPILQGNVNITHPDRMCYNIFSVLKNSKYCENDYLLLSGNAFSNVITALSIANKFRVPILRILIYNASTGKYIPQKLNIKTMHFEKDFTVNIKPVVLKEITQTLTPSALIAEAVLDVIPKKLLIPNGDTK